jgi:hypothetical protein
MVVILFEYLFLKKSKEIVINICMEYNKEQIAMYLNYKNNLNEINKQQNIKDGNMTVVQYYANDNNNNNKNNNVNNNKNNLDEENELANAAINLKGFQNIQNDIKNELENKGILSNNNNNNENNTNSNEEEINTETLKKNNLPSIININNKKNDIKQPHDLFNDLGKFGSKTPNDNNNNNTNNNNNNTKTHIISKRKHKELNSTISFEQKPTKKLKK